MVDDSQSDTPKAHTATNEEMKQDDGRPPWEAARGPGPRTKGKDACKTLLLAMIFSSVTGQVQRTRLCLLQECKLCLSALLCGRNRKGSTMVLMGNG